LIPTDGDGRYIPHGDELPELVEGAVAGGSVTTFTDGGSVTTRAAAEAGALLAT